MKIFLANSHRWLHEQLVGPSVSPDGFMWAGSVAEADLVIYLDPPWPDPDAPEPLRRLGRVALNKVYLFSQDDSPLMWAPGVYASAGSRRDDRLVRGGFYVPHHHREHPDFARRLEPNLVENDLLWSFVGSVATCPRVRGALMYLDDPRACAEDTERWHTKLRWGWAENPDSGAQTAFDRYLGILQRSAFVVCPRGAGASSIRIFEAMQAGKCPVIVSDDWVPPAGPDWSACSIRVPESEVGRLPDILRAAEAGAAALGKAAREAWLEHFSPARLSITLAWACMDLHSGTASDMRARARMLVRAGFSRPMARRVKTLLRRG